MTITKNGFLQTAFAIALVTATAAPAAFASQVLDQHQNASTGTNPINTNNGAAQTFTAGISGSLTEMDFNITSCCGGLGPLTVSLYGVSGGVPSGGVLAQQSVSANGSGNISAVNFSTPYFVTAGTEYAVVLTYSGNQNYFVAQNVTNGTDSYTGGTNLVWPYQYQSGWVNPGGGGYYADLEFQEYVTTAQAPEPSTWAMLAGGVAVLFAKRRRKTAA